MSIQRSIRKRLNERKVQYQTNKQQTGEIKLGLNQQADIVAVQLLRSALSHQPLNLPELHRIQLHHFLGLRHMIVFRMIEGKLQKVSKASDKLKALRGYTVVLTLIPEDQIYDFITVAVTLVRSNPTR